VSEAEWYVWLPFAIASVLLAILFVLGLTYYLRERKAIENADYVVVNDGAEGESFFSPKDLYTVGETSKGTQ
jgi:hypothetical protein